MARFAVFVALLGGCAQIFGLDEGAPLASLDVQRVSVGATLVYAPLDLTGLTAEYLVPSDDPVGFTRVPAQILEPGLWGAELDEPAPLLFQIDRGSHLRLHDFPHAQVKTLHGPMEHPNPSPAPPGATLTVNLTLDEAYNSELIQMLTLGAWNFHNLAGIPAMATSGTVTFDYTAMTSMTGRPHEKITTQDGVVVLRYTPASNPLQLAAFLDAAPFDQTGADTITGALTKVTLEPIEFRIDPGAAALRFAAVKPAVPPASVPVMNWEIRAAPGAQLGNASGPLVLGAAIAMTDTTISGMAGNPFVGRGWESILSMSADVTRPYTIPGGAEVTLRVNLLERTPPTPGVALLLPAGLPTEVTIGGVALSTDGMVIPKPTAAVEVSFTVDVAANTLYQVQLSKFSATGERTLVIDAAGVVPRFKLPPDVFEAGAYYTIRAVAVKGGFPGIAEGDLSQREIPLSIGFLDSGVFQVMP